MTDACTIMTTCGSEETALTIAAALVDQAYAACVNIVPASRATITSKARPTWMRRSC